MKRFLSTLMILAVAMVATARDRVIKNPEAEYTPTWICVNEIRLGSEATVLRCDLRNLPGWWVQVNTNTVLRDRHSEREYKLLRVEGVEADKQINMPESGCMACTLYFEPVAKDVTEVNFIEIGSRAESMIYGLKLTAPKRKAVANDKRGLTAEEWLARPFEPDTAWRFSAKPYKDMTFYMPGKARLVVHLDNAPKELHGQVASILMRQEEQILRKQTTLAPQLSDDNTYTADFDLPGPQFIQAELIGSVLLQPGDTLHVFTTMERDPKKEMQHRYLIFGGESEAAKINTLLSVLLKKELSLIDESKAYDMRKKAVDDGKESAEALALRWAEMADSLICDEGLRQRINSTPLSRMGKDLIMLALATKLAKNAEEVVLDYAEKQYKRETVPDGRVTLHQDSTWVPMDYMKVYAPLLRHKTEIYDNPLVLSNYDQWMFINRTVFSTLFRNYETVEDADGRYYHRLVDKYGMHGTFMYDIMHSQSAATVLQTTAKGLSHTTDDNPEMARLQVEALMDYADQEVADAMAGISYPAVAKTVLKEYRAIVRKYEGGAKTDDGIAWTDEHKALWQKIVGPYAGNLLFVDFWGMGCGPCRSGMISQRKTVEAMKDEPMRFLYVCDESDSPRDKAEAWMGENNIKGEHIYVSHAEWSQLMQMFNFTSIPHGALVAPDGKVLQNDFGLHSQSEERLRELIKKNVK